MHPNRNPAKSRNGTSHHKKSRLELKKRKKHMCKVSDDKRGRSSQPHEDLAHLRQARVPSQPGPENKPRKEVPATDLRPDPKQRMIKGVPDEITQCENEEQPPRDRQPIVLPILTETVHNSL